MNVKDGEIQGAVVENYSLSRATIVDFHASHHAVYGEKVRATSILLFNYVMRRIYVRSVSILYRYSYNTYRIDC